MANRKGYLGYVEFSGTQVQTRGEVRVGRTRNQIEITCIGDGNVPYRVFEGGMYDPIRMTLPVLWDATNVAIVAAQSCMTNDTSKLLTIKDTASGTTLLSGSALCEAIEWGASMDDVQTVNITWLFYGTPSTVGL